MYRTSVELKENYVLLQVEGSTSFESTQALRHQCRAARQDHCVNGLLADMRQVKGQLSGADVLQLVSEFDGYQSTTATAIVDSAERGFMNKVYQTMAQDRGHQARIFSTIDEAVRWLEAIE